MRHLIQPFVRRTAGAALLVTIALTLVPTAFADGWARDRAEAVAVQELDPAIRAAIAAHTKLPAPAASTLPRVPPSDEGFAWGAAGLGLATGIVAICGVLACVSLIRHDGRLRNA